ncbi:hypothetical protein JTB14_020357, partial [Gonioctena quinquepunctata]
IGPNFSYELPIDSETWPQQEIEEDETAEKLGSIRQSDAISIVIASSQYVIALQEKALVSILGVKFFVD